MECIFIPELDNASGIIIPPIDEAKHLKALHLNTGDKVLCVNGIGGAAVCNIIREGKNDFKLSITEYKDESDIKQPKVALGLGILDDKSRFEYALEKGIELGMNHFYPLITQFSQKEKVALDRLKMKSISAIKQCKRAFLPEIHTPIKPETIALRFSEFSTVLIADENGLSARELSITNDILLLVGPEGGFSEPEIKLFKDAGALSLKLGNTRLRAETAAIAGLARILV